MEQSGQLNRLITWRSWVQIPPLQPFKMNKEHIIKHCVKLIREEVSFFNGWWVSEKVESESCEKAAKKIFKYLDKKYSKACPVKINDIWVIKGKANIKNPIFQYKILDILESEEKGTLIHMDLITKCNRFFSTNEITLDDFFKRLRTLEI